MKRYLILLVLTLFAGITAFAQQDLQPVASIQMTRSEMITVKQLKDEIRKPVWSRLIQSLRRFPTEAELNREVQNSSAETRRQTLDLMINERLALQAAERERVTVSDGEFNQQITQLRAQLAQGIGRQVTDEEFAQAIKTETGMEMPAFRDNLRRQAIVQKYMMFKKEDQFRNIQQPSDREVIDFYNLNKSQFVRPDTVRFSMIEVLYGPDAASRARARELAERLNREIGLNATRFDETAMRSHAPNSGFAGGDAGYLPRNPEAQQIVGAEFMNIAFSLRQGEVSRLIEGQMGFQIIKITEIYEQRALDLDDIIQLGTRATVRQLIASNMMQQRQYETLARVTQELAAELRAASTVRVMDNNLNW